MIVDAASLNSALSFRAVSTPFSNSAGLAARAPGPLVTLVLSQTVPNADPMGLFLGGFSAWPEIVKASS